MLEASQAVPSAQDSTTGSYIGGGMVERVALGGSGVR